MSVPKSGMAPVYTSAFDCARKTFVNEGVRGFYKGRSSSTSKLVAKTFRLITISGMATPTMMVTPNFALAFFGYGNIRIISATNRTNGSNLYFCQVWVKLE